MSATAPRSVTEIALRILQHSTPDRLNFTFDTESSGSDLHIREKSVEAMRWNSDEQKWSVARPKPHPDFIKMVIGYALTCNMQLPAASDMITEARYQAGKNGRSDCPTDIRCALLDYQIPSDQALEQAFEPR